MPEYKSLADGCHCGGTTAPYRSRAFVNAHGLHSLKVFHKCRVCSSRFFDVQCPALDDAKSVSVTEILAGFPDRAATADIAVSDVSAKTSDWLLDTTASIVAQKQARYDALFEDSYVEHKIYGRSAKWHEVVKEMAGLKQMIEGHMTYFSDNQPTPEI